MEKKIEQKAIKPIIEKRKPLEEELKKDSSTEALAQAIKTLLGTSKK